MCRCTRPGGRSRKADESTGENRDTRDPRLRPCWRCCWKVSFPAYLRTHAAGQSGPSRAAAFPPFAAAPPTDSVDSGLRADLVIASSRDSSNVNSDRTVGCCGPGQLGQLGQRPCSVSKRGAKPRHSRQCHRKISSARDASDCGMTSPCTFALARFRARANLIGCSTGMSAGLLPRKIRSTNSAARRNWSFGSTE